MDFSCTSHHLSLLPLFKNLPWKFVHYGICETKFWEIGKGYEKQAFLYTFEKFSSQVLCTFGIHIIPGD